MLRLSDGRPMPDEKTVKARFDETVKSKPYLRMLEKTQVVGVWDDNDFGLNDGGAEF
jgi:alkaline phosphatase D